MDTKGAAICRNSGSSKHQSSPGNHPDHRPLRPKAHHQRYARTLYREPKWPAVCLATATARGTRIGLSRGCSRCASCGSKLKQALHSKPQSVTHNSPLCHEKGVRATQKMMGVRNFLQSRARLNATYARHCKTHSAMAGSAACTAMTTPKHNGCAPNREQKPPR